MTKFENNPKPKVSFRCGMKGTVLEKTPGEIPGTSNIKFVPLGRRKILGFIPARKKPSTADNVSNTNIDFRPPNDYTNVSSAGEFIVSETFDGSRSSDIYDAREEKLKKIISLNRSVIDIMQRELIKLRHIAQVSKDSDLLQREITKLTNNVSKWRTNMYSFSSFGGGESSSYTPYRPEQEGGGY